MTCTVYHILFGKPNPVKCDGRGMTHVMGERKPDGNKPPGKPRRRWDNNIKIHFQKVGWEEGARTGLIWLRIGTGGDHL
jgi:hypothetical protein